MNIFALGFAISALVLIVNRKDGPFGIFNRARSYIGTPLTCSVCAAFWVWIALLPLFLVANWQGITDILNYGGALGVAYAALALAGALDLDR